MYPYSGKLRWIIRGRHGHLVDAILAEPHLLEGARGGQLSTRVQMLKRWLKVRLAAVAILAFSALYGVVSVVLRAVAGLEVLAGALGTLARVTSALAGLALAIYYVSGRFLAQTEIDALMLFQLQNRDL